MARKSTSVTRASTRHQKTPKKRTSEDSGNLKTPKATSNDFKKIVGHRVYDEHYVEYEVKLVNGKKIKVTEYELEDNTKLLTDYKKKVTNQTDVEEEECEVEKVLTHRMVDGKPLYLVQWKGYKNPVWNSEMWEEDLSNCKELLTAYKGHSKTTKTPNTSRKSQQDVPRKSTQTSNSSKRRVPSPSNYDEKGTEMVSLSHKTKKQHSTPEHKSSTRSSTNTVSSLMDEIEDEEQEVEVQEEDEMEEVIERVEEVQEEDDEDESRGCDQKVSTSHNGTTKKWPFSWGWF